MAKEKNTFVIIAGIFVLAVVVVLVVQPEWLTFIITGNELVSRDYTSLVDAGATVNVNYVVTSASGSWGVSVIDTLVCPGILNQEKKFVIISDSGTTKTIQYTMPNTEGVTCTFTGGNYQFGNKTIKNFAAQTIQTRVTYVAHSTYSCYDNDVYWYDSNGARNDKKQECGTSAYGNNYCYNDDVYKDYVSVGCSSSSCTSSTSRILQQDCGGLGCSGGICNTKTCSSGADTDSDGTIDRTELGIVITDWVSGSATRDKLGQAIMDWSVGC